MLFDSASTASKLLEKVSFLESKLSLYEKELLTLRSTRYALESAGYNKARAAKLLGIHRSLLYKKMQKYEIPLVRNKPLSSTGRRNSLA